MGIIGSVFEISNEFMNDPSFVEINDDGIEIIAGEMIKSGQQKFKEPVKISEDLGEDIYKSVMMQLAGGAINYCYWYGKSDIRPNNSSSTTMFKAVENASEYLTLNNNKDFCDVLKMNLAVDRFPLLEERCRHIDEISLNGDFFIATVLDMSQGKHVVESLMGEMIKLFPGYASDMFLKRASLFFMMLYRFFGWFSKELHKIHIPADYQVPKMLSYFDCIRYSEELFNAISNNTLIPKYSQAECEIRAATIIACQRLGQKTGWNAAEIDGWFWLKRNECFDPFHLTVTTDY